MDVEIDLMIEHLKEANTSWHNSHSLGMNFGAMMSFGMNPAIGSCMMATPVVRNEKGYSIEETLSKSGIYAKENHIEIGEKIEITPTLRNEDHLHVFDTATINSIGNISAGIQEIQDLAKKVRQFKEAEIKDASPDIQEHVGEDFEEKFVEEAKVLVAKADEVKKAIEEKKPEAQETHTVQLKTYDDIVDEFIDAYFASQSTDPRDSVISAQTNGDVEDLVRKATLLRYDLEDFIAKYPNAAEWCAKIFVGATYVLQGTEYVVAFGAAGPAGVGAKYATQEGIATGVEHGIEVASNASAATLTKDPILQTEYSQTLKCFSYIGMCLGSVKPAKQLVKALKHGSAVRKQAQQSVASEFKFIKNINSNGPVTEFTSNIFYRVVEWTAPNGTRQTYQITQRNDINWYKIRENKLGPKDYIGRTNLEAALERGIAPELSDGSIVQLHHIRQQGKGGLVEVSSRTHSKYGHNEFGGQKKNPFDPVDREAFKLERPKYWKSRAIEVLNDDK